MEMINEARERLRKASAEAGHAMQHAVDSKPAILEKYTPTKWRYTLYTSEFTVEIILTDMRKP